MNRLSYPLLSSATWLFSTLFLHLGSRLGRRGVASGSGWVHRPVRSSASLPILIGLAISRILLSSPLSHFVAIQHETITIHDETTQSVDTPECLGDKTACRAALHIQAHQSPKPQPPSTLLLGQSPSTPPLEPVTQIENGRALFRPAKPAAGRSPATGCDRPTLANGMSDLRCFFQVTQPTHEAPVPISSREAGEAKDIIILTILAPETTTSAGSTTAISATHSANPSHQTETGAVPAGSSLQPAGPARAACLCRARLVCHLHGGSEAAGGRAGAAAKATRPGTGLPAAATAERRDIAARHT